MMKRTANIFLTSGLLIMLGTLAWATFGMQTASADIALESNTCLNCHLDAHLEWNWATSTQSTETTLDNTETFCINCHQTNAIFALSTVRTHIDTIQHRINDIRAELNNIYRNHPEWDTNTQHIDKTIDQRTAERITTLITFVEADGSWGFHDADYTDQLLSEAEFLIAELLDTSG